MNIIGIRPLIIAVRAYPTAQFVSAVNDVKGHKAPSAHLLDYFVGGGEQR
jgi:hypothetical protein